MGEKVLHWVEIHPPEYIAELFAAIERGETGDRKVPDDKLIKVPMVSASRVKAYERQDARVELRRWSLTQMGRDPDDDSSDDEPGPNLIDLPETMQREWLCLFQATDIVGAIVDDKCVNWTPPTDLAGWLDVEDYIFSPLLDKAWSLNPHWRLENTPLPKNESGPGSKDSNENSIEASEPG
jgi:hypothetical protein